MAGKFIVIAALAAMILSTAPAQGQTLSANPDSALQVFLKGIEGTHLTLEEAVRQGLANATAVRRAEASYNAALGTVRRERGIFDPDLFFNVSYEDDAIPTSSFFAGAPILMNQQTTASTGVQWSLPIGTQLQASINTVRLNTNSTFAFLNPQYTAFGSLSLRQPLLGGFGASARKQLSKAEQDLDAATARRDQQVLALTSDIELRYWGLYAAERDYAVRKFTRDQGEVFLQETQMRAKAGLVGPNQVANARTFLAEQKSLLIDTQEELDRLSDEFAALIGVRPEPGSPRFVTTSDPPGQYEAGPVDTVVERARSNNLDLRAAQSDVDAARTLASAAGWEMLPSVDLLGSLGGNGLAGSPQAVIFNGDTLTTTVNGGFSDAVNQVVNRDFRTWSVGVEVKIPIGFRNGLGEKDRLQAELASAEARYTEQERSLEAQVRTTYRELVHGNERLSAAKEGVEAAGEQGRIGRIEFYNGRTTAFELVRLAADYVAAQQRYSQALVRTAKAATTLKQLTSGSYTGTTTK
jgi:outer membrane protein TolC